MLFFGGGGGGGYTPAPTTTTTTQQAAQDANKGATEAQKTKKELQQNYGAALALPETKRIIEDTTLSSGSLLSIGGTLGG